MEIEIEKTTFVVLGVVVVVAVAVLVALAVAKQFDGDRCDERVACRDEAALRRRSPFACEKWSASQAFEFLERPPQPPSTLGR